MTDAVLDQPVGPRVESLRMIPLMLRIELCAFPRSTASSFAVSGCEEKV
jgi:hypothetical protein